MISSPHTSSDPFLSPYILVLITKHGRVGSNITLEMQAAAGLKINLGLKFPVFPLEILPWVLNPGSSAEGPQRGDQVQSKVQPMQSLTLHVGTGTFTSPLVGT